MEVPYKMLSKEALDGVIKDFILREGTDYGHCDYDIKQKVEQVFNQIKSDKARIVYDEKLDSCTIIVH